MVNIQEVDTKEILARIDEYHSIGGVLQISVFEILENYNGQQPDQYTAHLITARQTIEKANDELNLHMNKIAAANKRSDFVFAVTDFTDLDASGKKIELKHFLGPYYDIDMNKPLVRGQKGDETLNSYFYYDQQEILNNKVNIHSRDYYPENEGGFIYAFMEPVHNLRLERNIRKRGEYLIDFMNYFFGALHSLEIFSWSTACSPVFEPGKEWWGSYFWTIYNPQKKWYIGMIASETD